MRAEVGFSILHDEIIPCAQTLSLFLSCTADLQSFFVGMCDLGQVRKARETHVGRRESIAQAAWNFARRLFINTGSCYPPTVPEAGYLGENRLGSKTMPFLSPSRESLNNK